MTRHETVKRNYNIKIQQFSISKKKESVRIQILLFRNHRNKSKQAKKCQQSLTLLARALIFPVDFKFMTLFTKGNNNASRIFEMCFFSSYTTHTLNFFPIVVADLKFNHN